DDRPRLGRQRDLLRHSLDSCPLLSDADHDRADLARQQAGDYTGRAAVTQTALASRAWLPASGSASVAPGRRWRPGGTRAIAAAPWGWPRGSASGWAAVAWGSASGSGWPLPAPWRWRRAAGRASAGPLVRAARASRGSAAARGGSRRG